ncbi:hypothetical protein FEE36_04560 [Lactobacillus murinus]|nr:hypothetical protein [Ligilactobacillus murinus]NEF87049.1 hypothetical protein [Ligilactobacillus murinus]NEF89327.1 hypothetical protein [Ligilactobacillus murinus]NEF91596.1 hypothetical protein [Ligilactobacillus murinus]NEF93841.1 hypothetical protein [Ligilactobacillus murinus]
MIFLYFCLLLLKSLSQMAFYFSNLILQTAITNINQFFRYLYGLRELRVYISTHLLSFPTFAIS